MYKFIVYMVIQVYRLHVIMTHMGWPAKPYATQLARVDTCLPIPKPYMLWVQIMGHGPGWVGLMVMVSNCHVYRGHLSKVWTLTGMMDTMMP